SSGSSGRKAGFDEAGLLLFRHFGNPGARRLLRPPPPSLEILSRFRNLPSDRSAFFLELVEKSHEAILVIVASALPFEPVAVVRAVGTSVNDDSAHEEVPSVAFEHEKDRFVGFEDVAFRLDASAADRNIENLAV